MQLDGDDGHSVKPRRVFEIATVLSLLGFASQKVTHGGTNLVSAT